MIYLIVFLIILSIPILIISSIINMFKNSGEKRRKRLEEQKIKQRIIEEQREKEIKKSTEKELLIRIQNEDDNDAKLELGKIYSKKLFKNLEIEDKFYKNDIDYGYLKLTENDEVLYAGAENLFKAVIINRNLEGCYYLARFYDKFAEIAIKKGKRETTLDKAIQCYMKYGDISTFLRAGKLSIGKYRDNGNDIYFFISKEAYTKAAELGSLEAKEMLGRLMLEEMRITNLETEEGFFRDDTVKELEYLDDVQE
ncbi:hypothetical protein [Leptotrichia massiliensis]|uniref:hypothetical protein n=1 Tax=Leptotrichia massiliensis TaxID=1852388 RepID=UPI0028EF5F91|nr:hypothetical protein [Leptotrichia massiliensis]